MMPYHDVYSASPFHKSTFATSPLQRGTKFVLFLVVFANELLFVNKNIAFGSGICLRWRQIY